MTVYSYAIASGFDTTPVNVESLTPTGSPTPLADVVGGLLTANSHFLVRGIGNYEQPVTVFPNALVPTGAGIMRWSLSVVNYDALDWFLSTYANDATNANAVTITSNLNSSAYVSKNARLLSWYEVREARQRSSEYWATEVELTFSILEDATLA